MSGAGLVATFDWVSNTLLLKVQSGAKSWIFENKKKPWGGQGSNNIFLQTFGPIFSKCISTILPTFVWPVNSALHSINTTDLFWVDLRGCGRQGDSKSEKRCPCECQTLRTIFKYIKKSQRLRLRWRPLFENAELYKYMLVGRVHFVLHIWHIILHNSVQCSCNLLLLASPSSYLPDWVSQWVGKFVRLSYCIYRACELVTQYNTEKLQSSVFFHWWFYL